MSGDLARGMQGGDAAAKSCQAIGDLRFDAGIDARKIPDGRNITRLAEERKAATPIEQPMNGHNPHPVQRPCVTMVSRSGAFTALRPGSSQEAQNKETPRTKVRGVSESNQSDWR